MSKPSACLWPWMNPLNLYITNKAVRKIDYEGLEAVCQRAGLDLYAWTKPHWEAGSRQPLQLKVGWTNQARIDRKRWPLFEDKLNKGAPMADSMPGPHALNRPMTWSFRRTRLNDHTHEFVPLGELTEWQKKDLQKER